MTRTLTILPLTRYNNWCPGAGARGDHWCRGGTEHGRGERGRTVVRSGGCIAMEWILTL